MSVYTGTFVSDISSLPDDALYITVNNASSGYAIEVFSPDIGSDIFTVAPNGLATAFLFQAASIQSSRLRALGASFTGPVSGDFQPTLEVDRYVVLTNRSLNVAMPALDSGFGPAAVGDSMEITFVNTTSSAVTLTVDSGYIVDSSLFPVTIPGNGSVFVVFKWVYNGWWITNRMVSSGPSTNATNLIWRGAYSNTTTYIPNDVVSSGGSSWINILQSTGFTPPNATYWNLVAAAGTTGSTGAPGNAGTNAGFNYIYDSATSSGPASGRVRFSGATIGASTVMYVNETTADGVNVASSLLHTGDSPSFYTPQLWVTQATDPTTFVIFAIYQPPVDSGTYDTFNVLIPLASNGTFTNNTSVRLDFRPMGHGAGLTYYYTATVNGHSTKTLSFDTVTIGSISHVDLNVFDLYGNDLTATIEAWDDSTNTPKGTLKITSVGDDTKFAIFNVTGSITTPTTGYRRVPLTPVSTGTIWNSIGDVVRVEFTRTGDT